MKLKPSNNPARYIKENTSSPGQPGGVLESSLGIKLQERMIEAVKDIIQDTIGGTYCKVSNQSIETIQKRAENIIQAPELG